ncbi:MAG: hypothetical protein GVY16_09800 [Planctomycetes bacterium]|nr:hypothetical protein [Planctomycetota bacterium]
MGNKTGWIIAGIMVAFIAGLVIKFVFFASPSPATADTLAEGKLDLFTTGISVATVVDSEPSGSGNAANHYAKALEYIRENQAAWDAIDLHMGSTDDPLAANLLQHCTQVLDLIRPAARIKDMKYTFVYTPKEFIISPRAKATDDLWQIAFVCEAACRHYLRAKDYGKAADAGKALCCLGWHTAGERVRVEMNVAGFEMQVVAANLLQQVYADAGNDAALQASEDYGYAASAAQSRTVDKSRDLLQTIQPEPGDIFNVIENDKDHAWRVDCILQLGRLKFSAPGRGNQRYIKMYIDKYINSEDPYYKAAAEVAKSVTMEQLQDWVNE